MKEIRVHRYPGMQYHIEIRRRKRAKLGIDDPLTYGIKARLEDADCMWHDGQWWCPSREVQEMFFVVLAELAQEEDKCRYIVDCWHQELFAGLSGEQQKATASDLGTAANLRRTYGDEASEIVVVLARVVRQKWPKCVQLISAVRHYLDEAVGIYIRDRESKQAAVHAYEDMQAKRQYREARLRAIRRFNLMTRGEQAAIERMVLDADVGLAASANAGHRVICPRCEIAVLNC